MTQYNDKDTILKCCDQALASCEALVSDEETELQFRLAQYIDIFKKAAEDTNLRVSQSAVEETVTQVFWLSSNDMLPVMAKYPQALKGFVALRPAASRLHNFH